MSYNLVDFGNFVHHLNQTCHAAASTPALVLSEVFGQDLTHDEIQGRLTAIMDRHKKARKKGRSGAELGSISGDWDDE